MIVLPHPISNLWFDIGCGRIIIRTLTMYKIEMKKGNSHEEWTEDGDSQDVISQIRFQVEEALYEWFMDSEKTLERFSRVTSTLAYFERDMKWAEDEQFEDHTESDGEWAYTLNHYKLEIRFVVTVTPQ